MRPVGVAHAARTSVQHGAVGQGVLALLPVVLLARAVRAVRSSRVDAHRPDHTLGVAGHPSPDAPPAIEEKARGDRTMRRRPRRITARRPTKCAHRPACPPVAAPDRHAAKVIATHPDQGWSLLCNGVVLFDDLGAILPDGGVRSSGAQQVALLRRYGSRRRRNLPHAA